MEEDRRASALPKAAQLTNRINYCNFCNDRIYRTMPLSSVEQKFVLHWGEMGTRWGIVRVVHVLGDRRDHFESVKDVWEIFRIVAEERKRREIDPTLRVLQECVGEVKKAGAGSAYTRERLEEMLSFLTSTSELFDELVHIPTQTLKGMARLRGKLKLLFGAGKKAD